MRLGYKLFGLLISTWLLLTVTFYFFTQNIFLAHPFLTFTFSSLGLVICIFFLFNYYILNPLEKMLQTLPYKEKEQAYQIITQKEIDPTLELSLSKAISQNELVLFFQPQFNLKEDRITGVEALIRWNHPKFGLVSPDKFIPLAEETGLIMQLGEWAIHEACRIGKTWQEAGYLPVTIAVNISPYQFQQQNLPHIIQTALTQTGFDPHLLEIELTESKIMENTEHTLTELQRIHEMGITISIDDFGSGYTSINYLRQFPVQILKIDQSLIAGIMHSANDRAIVNAVISLGHQLGLKVVAEGIETKAQWQFLLEHDCDFIQGDFFHAACSEPEVAKLF